MVLQAGMSENRPWCEVQQTVCRIFVDAASTPACCAAMACIDGQILYTAVSPNGELLDQLERRGDKQITSLEIIAILLSVATFAVALKGRRVVLYSDNTGAEHATDKGSANAADHNKMVHEVWTLAFRCCPFWCFVRFVPCCVTIRYNMHLWIERVPSKQNISDLPSRNR